MKKVYEQTAADMDARFASGGFAAAGGNVQSLIFAYAALHRLLDLSPLKEPLRKMCGWTSTPAPTGGDLIEGLRATIYDIGCAEGDGTAMLGCLFPLSLTTGIDISPEAVRRARARWPHLSFEVGDIRDPPIDRASFIFALHTIEHMEDPAAVIQNLLRLCFVLVVVVPPIEDIQRGEAHVGAKNTDEWLTTLPKPLCKYVYNTLRPDLEANSVIQEGNILLAWKGGLTTAPY